MQGKGPASGFPPWPFNPVCWGPRGDFRPSKAGGVDGSGGAFKQKLLERAAARRRGSCLVMFFCWAQAAQVGDIF